MKRLNLVLGILLCLGIGVMAKSSSEMQDVSSLDRRLSLLEQRFYSVESSISRLQQYVTSQRPPVAQPSTDDREIILLREEVQRLSLRLSEAECALAKLDERTTTRKSSTPKPPDPCRQNPDTPLRLSTRP
ncbi:MAG TPA: hypothetical protein VF088_16710 [Pyrinomonadaceae bacterium]